MLIVNNTILLNFFLIYTNIYLTLITNSDIDLVETNKIENLNFEKAKTE